MDIERRRHREDKKVSGQGGGNNCPDGPSRGGGVSKQEGEVGWGLGGASVESEEEMEMEVEEPLSQLKPTILRKTTLWRRIVRLK